MQYVSQNAQDTRDIAAQVAHRVLDGMAGRTSACVLALRGPLGAGKTTFTQGFASALGIAQLPKSPTFMLAKRYPIPGTPYALWHLDCYRLTGHGDMAALDLHGTFKDPLNIVLVEWPENIGDGIPRDRLEIHFQHGGGDKRDITISEP